LDVGPHFGIPSNSVLNEANLTKLFFQNLMVGGEVFEEVMFSKFVCFGTYEVIVF
jgi:hypothetical protein